MINDFIEKFFENPRHIEVQILSDGKDNTVHLGERDCSVQRRYQKIIEESPCPVINDEQRKYLLDVSVNAISKLCYEGAGTLEFIYDKGKFYFYALNIISFRKYLLMDTSKANYVKIIHFNDVYEI